MPEQVQSESRYIDVGGTTRLLIIQMVAVEASQLWRARSLGGSRVARGQLQGPSAPCSLRLQGILPSQQVQVRPVRSRWRPRQKGRPPSFQLAHHFTLPTHNSDSSSAKTAQSSPLSPPSPRGDKVNGRRDAEWGPGGGRP